MGRPYLNYQFVESVRTPNGPRQKTICSLGDLGPGSREEWASRARKLEHAFAGQEDLLEPSNPEAERALEKAKTKPGTNTQPTVREPQRHGGEHIAIDPKLIATEHHREAGTMHVSYEFWKRFGLDDILKAQELPERTRQLACGTTLNRLIMPASEHASMSRCACPSSGRSRSKSASLFKSTPSFRDCNDLENLTILSASRSTGQH